MCQCNKQNCGCVPKDYTSSLIYDGLILACPDLAAIKPNCSSLNELLQAFGELICSGTVGPVGPQGPQGIQGVQGDPGLNGANGAPGLNGTNGTNGTNGVDGVVYEHFAQAGAHSFQLTETIIVSLTHALVGATGDYQVQVNLNTSLQAVAMPAIGTLPEFFLYVNGVKVSTRQMVVLSESDGTSIRNASLSWRGPISTGQLIEVRTITVDAANIAVLNGEILINKEA